MSRRQDKSDHLFTPLSTSCSFLQPTTKERARVRTLSVDSSRTMNFTCLSCAPEAQKVVNGTNRYNVRAAYFPNRFWNPPLLSASASGPLSQRISTHLSIYPPFTATGEGHKFNGTMTSQGRTRRPSSGNFESALYTCNAFRRTLLHSTFSLRSRCNALYPERSRRGHTRHLSADRWQVY